VFERKSGTGRGREIRKGGYGGAGAAGRWEEEATVAQETIQAESENTEAKQADPSQTATATATTLSANDNKNQEAAPETDEQKALREENEAESKKKSFDEWLLEKRKKAVEADSQLNTREVEVDEKQFKASKVLEKEEDAADYSALKKERQLAKKGGKGTKKKYSLFG
jgi:hypothetical protein